MANLRLDFYESGIGDTVLITFPDGTLGLVDAHPSSTGSRPDIVQIVGGRRLRFVCLTHPHEDHALDLVRVLESGTAVDEFWHTNSDVYAFISNLTKMQNWPSPVTQFAKKMERAYANVFIDLYAAAYATPKKTRVRQVRAGTREEIAGVEVHVIAPEERHQEAATRFWMTLSSNPSKTKPDPNLLSAVLALRWGDGVVLLGADALVSNWHDAVPRYQRLQLPKTVVLKVPHHGAGNAYNPSRGASRQNYLDVCMTQDKQCKAILFAGDDQHPQRQVYERLLEKTEVHCLINGLGTGFQPGVDLGIELSGASPVRTLTPCQPAVSVEVFPNAHVNVLVGKSCGQCAFAPAIWEK